MEQSKNSLVVGIFTGTVSAVLGSIPLQPLDVIKTRLQQENKSARIIIKSIYSENGILGFWRGVQSTLLRNVPGVALYFSFVHYCEKLLYRFNFPKTSTAVNLAVGVTCRSLVALLLMPFTVAKTRFESNLFAKQKKSLVTLLKELDVRTLYRGSSATILRDAPYAGVYYSIYQNAKQVLHDRTLFGSFYVNTSAALFSGLLATAVTQPFDVVKTNLQLTSSNSASMFSVSKSIWSSRGPSGFFVGLWPRVFKKATHSALAWVLFEEIKKR